MQGGPHYNFAGSVGVLQLTSKGESALFLTSTGFTALEKLERSPPVVLLQGNFPRSLTFTHLTCCALFDRQNGIGI